MATVKCSACQGTYPTTQPDGTLYFHACPPLSDAEVAKTLGKPVDVAAWTQKDRDDVAAAPRTRANARDENLLSTAAKDKGTMKAAGAGVVTVP